MTRRLIEDWLPVAEIGIESKRERGSLSALPPTYYLHVWWARRPLVASRAAVLASLLPADADRGRFLRVLGIHGDPLKAREAMAKADAEGDRLGGNPYGYRRAFTYSPDNTDKKWISDELARSGNAQTPAVLDPAAGGGSIPFETARLGFSAFGNDLNPVAGLVEKLTLKAPLEHGPETLAYYRNLAQKFVAAMRERLSSLFPPEDENCVPADYVFARTIRCPHCGGLIPLSPNWRLAPDGTGVRLRPNRDKGVCEFEIVHSLKEQSQGTVKGGVASCPYPDCGRTIDGDTIKALAQKGEMGEQLYAVVYKKKIERLLKSGKPGKPKWERGYRAPRPEDDVFENIKAKLAAKLPDWEADDIVPTEAFPPQSNDDRPIQYGMPLWRDMFSPRQLYCHATGVEVFRELYEQEKARPGFGEAQKAAFGYLALALDKTYTYGCRSSRWIPQKETIASCFERHDFALKWSFAEMAVLADGYEWALAQVGKALSELIDLLQGKKSDLTSLTSKAAPAVTLTCGPGAELLDIPAGTIDAVVMDPPYYDNVMYAELSDFFYVWLKRTAGLVYPGLFRRPLTDKENEAVANPARFRSQAKPRELAAKAYRDAMAAIFTEARRVLKPDGILTVMFTHKATGAWDALASGLMDAGFAISASWPIATEAEISLHIRDKAAAKTTIFLVCRPRAENPQKLYWEDLQPQVRDLVIRRVAQFSGQGIGGIDLYLACFGPALELFSANWPVRRQLPRPGDGPDADSVSPEEALDTARAAVKDWVLNSLLGTRREFGLDPLLEFYILAWNSFHAASFPIDEAINLGRVAGVDLERDVIGKIAAKDGSSLLLWDAATRQAKSRLGPADGSESLLDALQHAILLSASQGPDAAKRMIRERGLQQKQAFIDSFNALLKALPPGPDRNQLDAIRVLGFDGQGQTTPTQGNMLDSDREQ